MDGENVSRNTRFQSEYQKCSEECLKKTEGVKDLCKRVSRWRMLVFVFIGMSLYAGYQYQPAFYWGAAAGIALFLRLIWRHNQLEEEQGYLEDSRAVAEDYLARFGEGWKRFPVNGEQYLSGDFPEARDLDIFGKCSLYQYICTASTVWGQDQLALWLKDPGRVEDMKSRQQAVEELAQKEGFSREFEAAARRLRDIGYQDAKDKMGDFFQRLEREEKDSAARRAGIWMFPAMTVSFLLLSLFGPEGQVATVGAAVCVMLQFLAACIFYGWNHKILSPVYKMSQVIEPYQKLFGLLEQEEFESPYLCGLQMESGEGGALQRDTASKVAGGKGGVGDSKVLYGKKAFASEAFGELERIAGSIATSHNPYGFVLCNSLYLHDFHCVERYLGWKEKYQMEIKGWMEAIGKVEALISLGVISRTKQAHTMPHIADSDCPKFSASDLRHPLIKDSLAVGNDIDLSHRVVVVTGSNMSGKTTFLRSIGINLVLAYAGGFCTALRMCISPMELCTSMRAEDDVNAGISTFYAELLRIKHMIQVSKKKRPMIALIDEIYKGTNSQDRIFAAKETVKNLSQPYAFTLLTTHDFELCGLEQDPDTDAENYYFTEHYEQDRILFDYKIRRGRCRTTNARYLLRMAGILNENAVLPGSGQDGAERKGVKDFP